MTDVKIAKAAYCCCLREPIYTEAQLKQYGDDRAKEALEMAANAVHEISRNGAWVMKVEAIAAIKDSIK